MVQGKKPEKSQEKNPKHSGSCCQPNAHDKTKQPQQTTKKPQGK